MEQNKKTGNKSKLKRKNKLKEKQVRKEGWEVQFKTASRAINMSMKGAEEQEIRRKIINSINIFIKLN
jgi:hypothetical protein